MAHLFISHSTRDGGAIAQQLAALLEAAGHRCWIAPRDVRPGVPYPGQIVSAIESCVGLVLVVTPAANDSPDVLQEIQLANTARKVIAPVVVNATAPGPDMRYYIGVRHQIPWSDARATATELLRSFPAGSVWAPSLADAGPADQNDCVDVLMVIPGTNKISVIKVVRAYTGWGMVEAKLAVEGSPPCCVGKGMPRAHALAMVQDLKAQGATMLDPVASNV